MTEEMENIDKIYAKVNDIFCRDMNFDNNQINRTKIKQILESELGEHFCIKCDEENNSPTILENFCLVTTIEWNRRTDGYYQYCNLVFGTITSVIDIYQYLKTSEIKKPII